MPDYSFSDLPMGCPIDGSALTHDSTCLRCSLGHSFDIAKQGYSNLLPVQFKPSREPGDSQAMVAARRQVFDAGLFDCLRDEFIAAVTEQLTAQYACLPTREPVCVVDAGCGEGFYTQALCESLAVPTLGIDISKPAILLAAKRYRTPCFAIANNKRLPLLSGRASIITSLFGFDTWAPWSAMQLPGQSVICVDAGRDHLQEMRKIIYPELVTHEPPESPLPVQHGYQLISTLPLRHTHTAVTPVLMASLLMMTPHGVKAGASGAARLREADTLPVTIDAIIRIYQRLSA